MNEMQADLRDWEVNTKRYQTKPIHLKTDVEDVYPFEEKRLLSKIAYDEIEELKKLRQQSLDEYRKSVEQLEKLNPQPQQNYKEEMERKIEQRNPSKVDSAVSKGGDPAANNQTKKMVPVPRVVSDSARYSNKPVGGGLKNTPHAELKVAPKGKRINKGKAALLLGGLTAGGIGGKMMYDKMHEEKTAFIEMRMGLEKSANEYNKEEDPNRALAYLSGLGGGALGASVIQAHRGAQEAYDQARVAQPSGLHPDVLDVLGKDAVKQQRSEIVKKPLATLGKQFVKNPLLVAGAGVGGGMAATLGYDLARYNREKGLAEQ